MSIQWGEAEDNIKLADTASGFDLTCYPIDMSRFLAMQYCALDAGGIPYHINPEVYHPTTIVQYALAHWNQYLANHAEHHRRVFLTQATWLVKHESRIGDVGGWPITLASTDVDPGGAWLSALTQGNAISVLVRAYKLTHEDMFLEVAHRAVGTFNRDILDGGVSAPLGKEGIFFEEVAIYPAAHMLSGFIFALFGLYDYVALTGDNRIKTLIHRSLTTMHCLLDEFDLGFWTRPHLLYRSPTSPAHLALQAALLEALAKYADCDHCRTLALHWKKYLDQFGSRLHYVISSRYTSYRQAIGHQIRTALFSRCQVSRDIRVCVPITAFPVTGGTRAVLAGVAQVMANNWQLEYVTQVVGLHADEYVIHRFGTKKMHPWQFPAVWLYVLAGFRKLISLMRHGTNYRVILPQDGVFTAAFAALAGKLAGVRVVCIDHGNLTLVKSRTYRAERIEALKTKNWPWLRCLMARLQYMLYWPTLHLLALISARFVDHFLVPGVAGDGVEEICANFGIHTSRLTRFASIIDTNRYVIPDATSKANTRERNGIARDAIVIAMACRLAPEKGIDIALEAISRALSMLSPELHARVRVIIAGDGPLHKHLEEDIRRRGLSQSFLLWGETSAQRVIELFGLSDIFLYTSTRGACISMAILEAMASGCAVVASTLPMANVQMLAEGRGITVSPGDAEETSMALVRLLKDLALCHQMGYLAGEYVAVQHSATTFRRILMRTIGWLSSDEILSSDTASGR